MQKYIGADWIFPVTSPPIQNGVLCLSSEGEVLNILTNEEARANKIQNIAYYQGALVPGFVNTHCHLELSHLWRRIEQHTGLPGFIKKILAMRKQDEQEIEDAMEQANLEMYHNGIVAVGDISNELISKEVKSQSKLYYHTFIEVFGFNRPSEPIIAVAERLKIEFSPLKASVVPHAPYSVSSELFGAITNAQNEDDIQSIHNQETQGEKELFEKGTGRFAEFFAEAGIAQSEAHGKGRNSIRYHLPQLKKDINTLLVHNTMTDRADIEYATELHQNLFWCLCPNANQYIENTLPDVELLNGLGVTLTLGTDSLASNTSLNILTEMKTLQVEKNIDFESLLQWATLNGARFLNIDNQYGSFDVGKKPGIVLIELDEHMQIGNVSNITRLV